MLTELPCTTGPQGQGPLACENPAEASHGDLGARGEGEGLLLRKALPGGCEKLGTPARGGSSLGERSRSSSSQLSARAQVPRNPDPH